MGSSHFSSCSSRHVRIVSLRRGHCEEDFALSACSRAGLECCSDEDCHSLDFLIMAFSFIQVVAFAAFSCGLCAKFAQQLFWPVVFGGSWSLV